MSDIGDWYMNKHYEAKRLRKLLEKEENPREIKRLKKLLEQADYVGD